MNKKKIIIVISLVFAVTICAVTIKLYYGLNTYSKDNFTNLIFDKIDGELEKERFLDVGYYELSDLGNGVFKITHFLQKNRLEMLADDTHIVLFEDVKGYTEKNEKLYLVSDEGIASISKNDILKIYIFDNQSDSYTPFTTNNEYGTFYYNKYYKDDQIKRLCEFDEFSKKERSVLKRLLNKYNIELK